MMRAYASCTRVADAKRVAAAARQHVKRGESGQACSIGVYYGCCVLPAEGGSASGRRLGEGGPGGGRARAAAAADMGCRAGRAA